MIFVVRHGSWQSIMVCGPNTHFPVGSGNVTVAGRFSWQMISAEIALAEVREALGPKVTNVTKERKVMASSGRWTQALKELPVNSGKQMQVLKEESRLNVKGRNAPTKTGNKD